MIVKLLTEHNLEFLSVKGGCQARPSLHLSKCQIVGNLMPRLNYGLSHVSLPRLPPVSNSVSDKIKYRFFVCILPNMAANIMKQCHIFPFNYTHPFLNRLLLIYIILHN